MESTMNLMRGLPRDRLVKEIFFHYRNGESARRALGFYLLDMRERREYAALGYSNVAHFAEKALGLPRPETRDILRVTAALEDLPVLDGAFSRGEIDWSKVRELVRVATAETEAEWLEVARKKTARQVQWAIRRKKKGQRPRERELDTHPLTVRINVDVPIATSHLWNVALAKLLGELGEGATPAEALKAMAELVLKKEPDGSVPGMRERKEPVYVVVYHVGPDGRSAYVETEEGQMPVPLAAVVEVAKAARVVEVEDLAPGEGKEIPLGERGTAAVEERDRPATEAMKTAAFLRHGGRCAVCGSESELRTHHFDSAADGGKTVVRKLLLVCLRCHANLHGGVTHLWMDASEGLIPLDRDGAPLQKEGGPAAVLRDAGETYPLVVIKKVSWGEAGPDPGATPRVEPAGAAPAGDSGGLRQLPQDDSRELSQPVPDTSQDDSRELCPPVPPPAAFDSLDDLPAEVTAAEWRSLSGRLEWSSARRSFVLRSEWSGVWVHSPTILPPEVDSRESSFKSEMASRNDLRKADALTASALRPGALEGFIGQKRTVENLLVAIRAAGKRGEPLSHVLLSGPPGLGKTTLSRLVARELGTGFHPAVGTHLEEPHEIIALLAGLGPRDVLFIDEVHGLRKACQECLYGALEDGIADVAISEGLRARALRIRLEPFTLIGATTELGALSEPFRSRFALEERLEFYSEADLARVAAEAAPQLKVSLHPRASAAIARRARGSPREGLRLLGRTRDVFQARKAEVLDAAIAIEARDVEAAARGLEIDADGLNQGDRRILDLLAKAKRPMGLEAIAAALRMDAQTLKVVHEPYLLERGYIARGPRGREATRTGRLRASGRTLIFDGKSIPIVGMLRFA